MTPQKFRQAMRVVGARRVGFYIWRTPKPYHLHWVDDKHGKWHVKLKFRLKKGRVSVWFDAPLHQPRRLHRRYPFECTIQGRTIRLTFDIWGLFKTCHWGDWTPLHSTPLSNVISLLPWEVHDKQLQTEPEYPLTPSRSNHALLRPEMH